MFILNNILKYLVYTILIIVLFNYIPRNNLHTLEISTIAFLLLSSFIFLDFLSLNNNNIEKFEDNDKPQILKELENNNKITKQQSQDIIKLCTDEYKCSNKLKELLNNNIINTKQFLQLNIIFGLNNYKDIQNLLLQERLNSDNALDIAYILEIDSKLLLHTLLDKLINNKIISKDDAQILYKLKNKEDYKPSTNLLSNLLEQNYITPYQTYIINNKCSSTSLDSCSIQLKKLKDDKVITNSQAVNILKSFNRPSSDIFEFDNSEFGSISNDSNLTSLNNMNYQELNNNNSNNNNSNNKKINIYDENDYNTEIKNILNNSKDNKIKSKIHNVSYKYNDNNDMQYNIYKNNELHPIGKYTQDMTNKFDHNHQTYLATDKWKTPEYQEPLCKINDKCDYCDDDELYPVNINNFNNSRKVLQPDNINISYIDDKLNTGKN